MEQILLSHIHHFFKRSCSGLNLTAHGKVVLGGFFCFTPSFTASNWRFAPSLDQTRLLLSRLIVENFQARRFDRMSIFDASFIGRTLIV